MNLPTRGLNQFVNLFVHQPRRTKTHEGPRSARGHTPEAFGTI
jgi:hypothetical protein